MSQQLAISSVRTGQAAALTATGVCSEVPWTIGACVVSLFGCPFTVREHFFVCMYNMERRTFKIGQQRFREVSLKGCAYNYLLHIISPGSLGHLIWGAVWSNDPASGCQANHSVVSGYSVLTLAT